LSGDSFHRGFQETDALKNRRFQEMILPMTLPLLFSLLLLFQSPEPGDSYVLGPEDTLSIKVHNAEEIGGLLYPIDLSGNLDLPMAGQVRAAGLTIDQLKQALTERFKEYIQEPNVTVVVSDYRSQPISILGQVGIPGVHQMRGRKTLFEVISEAGGLKPEAGSVINITRRKEWGPIPLPGAHLDSTGAFSVGEINIRDVMDARNPQDNIPIKPYDVITVPRADLIYVIGSVQKAGGFVLSERANLSILQALSMAEGLQRTAATSKAKIIRGAYDGAGTPTEIPVDVKKILDGKAPDVPLLANDILFIPNSTGKAAAYKTLDAIIQGGTMAAVYRPF
jgi:polysaccharide biosynthesis/export protein